MDQPKDTHSAVMDPYRDCSKDDDDSPSVNRFDCPRNHHSWSGCCECRASPKGCHQQRRRYIFIFLLFGFLLFLGVLLADICTYHPMEGTPGFWDSISGGLLKRAAGDAQPFVDRKYYLIIVFVGLFLVLILGIMLSAWCCRGVFENPCCFPCYLCACCGGLACLECVGCGLCVEAAEVV